MTLRLPAAVHDLLRAEAFEKRVSITSLIVAALTVTSKGGRLTDDTDADLMTAVERYAETWMAEGKEIFGPKLMLDLVSMVRQQAADLQKARAAALEEAAVIAETRYFGTGNHAGLHLWGAKQAAAAIRRTGSEASPKSSGPTAH